MMQTENARLLTVEEAAGRMAVTEAALRRIIFADTDEFTTRCVVRLGRRVRIRSDRLDEFIERATGREPFQHSDEWREKCGRPATAAG